MANGTAIRSPTDDLGNHTIVLRQLKEIAEVGQRLRGDPTQSFVRISELVSAGIVRFVNNIVQPPPASSSSSGTVNVLDSITGDGSSGSPLQLSGDSATPGNTMLYGTNGSGVKGWYAQPSSGGSGVVLIGKSVASSPVSSLTVSSIPGTYSAIQIVIYGLSTLTSNTEMFVTLNGDTGSNYDLQYVQGFGGTTQAGGSNNQTSADIGTFAPSGSGVPGMVSTIIGGYASTTTGKTGIGSSGFGGSTTFAQARTWTWHPSTPAAITSVTVTIQSGNIATGGFLAVYGLP